MSIPPSPVAPTVQAAGDWPGGDYLCKCATCGQQYIGPKRSACCMSCARPTVEAPAASDVKDAQRYRWLRSRTSGGCSMPGSPATFRLPDVKPVGNIMRGSVAQHLDEAIDAAMDVHQAASPCEKDFHADRALSASAPSAEGWVSVADRMPTAGQNVLVFWPRTTPGPLVGWQFAVAQCWPGASIEWHNPEDDEDDYVTPSYWMPLPPAPGTLASSDAGSPARSGARPDEPTPAVPPSAVIEQENKTHG